MQKGLPLALLEYFNRIVVVLNIEQDESLETSSACLSHIIPLPSTVNVL